MIEIALFFMAKRFTVTNEKLEVARIRLIDPRIVNLINDAMTQSEPKPATTGFV